jgi:hypothetical protein
VAPVVLFVVLSRGRSVQRQPVEARPDHNDRGRVAATALTGRTTDRASILAFQRAAGNRAVVQRLLYSTKNQNLVVPKSYGDRQLPWDGENYLEERAVRQNDPTLAELATKDLAVKKHLMNGLDIKNYEGLDKVTPVADSSLADNGAKLAAPDAEPGLAGQLRSVVVDPHRLIRHSPGTKYQNIDEPTISLVMLPQDFIPSPPDLGGKGVSVRAKIPKDPLGTTYWEYMCVIIALVKADGYATVKRLTGKQTNALQPAVQALNDYYLTKDVQFDDSSTRRQVMKEWDYNLIFSGNSEWQDLPAHVELKKENYIFDIPGHTVMVELKQAMPRSATPLTKLSDYFVPKSEKDNFDKDEFASPVTYIWARG